MKKIKNANELVEGQKYLIELEYRYDKSCADYPHDFYNKDDDTCFGISNELKHLKSDKHQLNIYEKQEVEAIETPYLDEVINDFELMHLSEREKNKLAEYKKIKSILQNVGKQVELPVVGEEYEFSDDGVKWFKATLKGYWTDFGIYRHIRPIQQSEEEREAIELLKNLGYKVEK